MQTITCSYQTPCHVSVEEMNGQPVLKLDFDIKEYKVCDNGWKDYQFPENIVINDKLYLNEETKDTVIQILEDFVETSYLEHPMMGKTQRGFSCIDFKDEKGNKISIQDSSAASAAYIWFGCDTHNKIFVEEDGKLIPFKFPQGDGLVSDRMHLNQEQAQQLKDAIVEEWQNYFENQEKLGVKKAKL